MIYTYEILRITNRNANTRAFAASVAQYLTKVQEVVDLRLYVDDKQYHYQADSFNENELKSICRTLTGHKKIKLSLRVMDGFSFAWKSENSFLKLLDDKLLKYVTYKATEYSDDDATVNLCCYDADGLRYPDGYTKEVPDIEKWYCRTPEVTISAEDESANQELYHSLKSKLDELKAYCDAVQLYEDEWTSSGSFEMVRSVSFYTKDIPKIVEIIQSIKDELAGYASGEFEFLLCGVPDREKDYDFAAVKISDKDTLKPEYIKF